MIRDAASHDLAAILQLNSQWEHVTSPLDEDSLARLHEQASYHRVVESGTGIAAFMLALEARVDYDSPNYRWFDSSSADFLYIDRIVVGDDHQRSGLGDALYDDARDFALERGITRLVCEVDIEPLNVASDRFHTRRGFVEVGTQWLGQGAKRVSLRECRVEAGSQP